ncbi:hypothetical protein D3C76_749730 [compost metagenome]
MWTGFCRNVQTSKLSIIDFLNGDGRADMNKMQPAASTFTVQQRPGHCLQLCFSRAASRKVTCAGSAISHCICGQHRRDSLTFGMKGENSAQSSNSLHSLIECILIHFTESAFALPSRIGEKGFKPSDASSCQCFQIIQISRNETTPQHIINGRVSSRSIYLLTKRSLVHSRWIAVKRHICIGCAAASCQRRRTAAKAFPMSKRWFIKVDMHINHTGEHIEPLCVDDFG